jgi:phosphoribosylformylglycinamidine synthase
VGALPLAVTDNLNFGSPERPEIFWQMAESCRGISAACQALGTPVTGGNVSLYNEIQDEQGSRAIYPTPTIGMVGLVEDLHKTCTLGFKEPGDFILLLGPLAGGLGASEYLAVCHGVVAGRPTPVNLDQEVRVQACCYHLIQQGWLHSAHDCSEGGLAVALAEATFPAFLGARIELPVGTGVEVLFGEAASRIIVSGPAQHQDQVLAYVASCLLADEFLLLGQVQGEHLVVRTPEQGWVDLPVGQLHQVWSQSLGETLAG